MYQAQTLTIRQHLRRVLDQVRTVVGSPPQGQPLVDLVLSGHAHCLEVLQTVETGHGDAGIHWIVCGGSGYSLRRQRSRGPDLSEEIIAATGAAERLVARSQLYIGRSGYGSKLRRPYSCLRIDVRGGQPPEFILRPFVAERFQGEWLNRAVAPFSIGGPPRT